MRTKSAQKSVVKHYPLLTVYQFSLQVFEDIHLDKRKTLKNMLSVMNYIFAVTFTLEMLLKIFGMGFVGYFSNLWNCLDCFIVAVSLGEC